jgi:hypothetical protein
MFPNVRLMIAATLASVVALICGFGVFAVFHVGHEPLVRLPAATAPLQLVADNVARSAAGFVSSDAFDTRLAVNTQPNAAEAANAPAAGVEPRAAEPHTEAQPVSPAQPSAAASEQTLSSSGGPAGEPATPAVPALAKADPPADDQADLASAPQPEPTFSTTTADAAAPADATIAEPEQRIKSPVVALAAEDVAPGRAIETAANEPATAPTASRAHANPTAASAGAAKAADPRLHKAAEKKLKRIRTAVRAPRAPRLIVIRYLRPRYPPAQYASITEQGFGNAQDPNFQPTTSPRYGAAPTLRVRYLRIAVRKTARPTAGIGGPFVSATSR